MGIQTNNNHLAKTSAGFAISKGVDLKHWLAQTHPILENKIITEYDISSIREQGFDHVRISIDERELWNEDGLIIGKPFLHLKKCVDWCMKHSLRVIISLQSLRNFSNKFADYDTAILWHDKLVRETFFKIWRNLSDFLKEYPKTKIAYELLSSPNAPNSQDWNSFIAESLAWIRDREPERTIIVGANKNGLDISELNLPFYDKNIIVSVQLLPSPNNALYDTQTKGIDTRRKSTNSDDEEEPPLTSESIANKLRPAALYASKKQWPLYCCGLSTPPAYPADLRYQFYENLTQMLIRNRTAFSHSNVSHISTKQSNRSENTMI